MNIYKQNNMEYKKIIEIKDNVDNKYMNMDWNYNE